MAVDKITETEIDEDEYSLLLNYLDNLAVLIMDARTIKSKIVNNLYEYWPLYSEREKEQIVKILSCIHNQCDCFDHIDMFLDGAGKK